MAVAGTGVAAAAAQGSGAPAQESPAAAQGGAAATPGAPPAGGSAAHVTLDSTRIKGYEAASLPVEGNAVVLTLDKAIEVGLQHNHDIDVSRYTRAEARLNILAALGFYDLLFTGNFRYADTTSPCQTIIGNTVVPSSSGKTTTSNLNL